MPREIAVSDYSYELIRKRNDENEGALFSRDRIAEAFFGRFGDRASTEMARNRIFWMARQVTGESVLDVGTSEGILPILLAREGVSVTGIDINAPAIDYARSLLASESEAVASRVSYHVVDLATFMKGKTYDTIIVGEVLEHLISASRFFKLCSQNLAKDGRLVLTTPFGIHPDPDHKASYFLSDIVRLVTPTMTIHSLEVVDGYIRLVATNNGAGTEKKRLQSDGLGSSDDDELNHLLTKTEAATHAVQLKALRMLDDRRRQLQEASAWIKTLEDERDALKSEAIRFSAELQPLVEGKAQAEAAARETRKELADVVAAKEKVETALEDVRKRAEEADTERERLTAEVEALGKVRAGGEAALRAAQARIASIDEERARLAKEVKSLADGDTEARTSLSVMESQFATMVEERDRAIREKVRLESEVASLRAEKTEMDKSLNAAQAARTAAEDGSVQLRHILRQHREDIFFAKAQLAGLIRDQSDAVYEQTVVNALKPATIDLDDEVVPFNAMVESGAEYDLHIAFERGKAPRQTKLALVTVRFFADDGAELPTPYAGFSQSKVGAYRYFEPVKNDADSMILSFRAPENACRAILGLRRWQDRQPVAVINGLRLVDVRGSADSGRLTAVLEKLQAIAERSISASLTASPVATASQAATAASSSQNAEASTPPLLEKTMLVARPQGKALYILDEISAASWSASLDLVELRRSAAEGLIESVPADFVFLESCWKGNGGDWEYAFTSPDLAHANAQTLLATIDHARKKGLPVVFWNKEDPMHFDRFLPIAEKADVVLTTDSNKIPDYRRAIPGAKVDVIPFAALPSICNPIDRSRTVPESVCFAGAYYPEHHDERVRQMDFILPAIEAFDGAIYDRYSHLPTDRYRFPDRYKPFIRPSVPFTEVTKVYKQFKVFLNVNTIVDSPTMMSRRVYELLASGTPVVSAPSRALSEQFSGIVQTGETEAEIKNLVGELLHDDTHWHRTSQRGLREVMSKHTYAQRTDNLLSIMGRGEAASTPLVSIIVASNRPKNVARTIENVTRQVHPRCEVIYALTPNFSEEDRAALASVVQRSPNIERAEVLVLGEEVTLGRCLNEAIRISKGDYIAKFDDDNFYLENYLSDLLLPFQFDDFDIVGKESYFCYLGGVDRLILRFPDRWQRNTKFVAGDAMIMKRSVFERTAFPEKRVGEDTKLLKDVTAYGGKIYSADNFNFIKYRSADLNDHTWRETEEKLLRQSVEVAKGLDLTPVRL